VTGRLKKKAKEQELGKGRRGQVERRGMGTGMRVKARKKLVHKKE